MSATDELRSLLDGRGVEWGAGESELDHVTTWNANGGQAMFYESKTTNPNLLQVNYYYLTPEQAVEATLGRGTCHETIIDHHWRGCCSCGYIWEFMYVIGRCERPHYCPNCGRKVVDAWLPTSCVRA